MKIKILLRAIPVFAAISMVASVASADYVCNVSYSPRTNVGYGSEGYVYVSLYSGTECSGNYVGGYYLCTTGATQSSCAVSAFRYERQGITAVFLALQQAAGDNQRLNMATATCNGGASNCGAYPSFYP